MNIEAMKQALEALEWGQPIIEDYGSKEQLQAHLSAKDALYKAIEADMYRNPDTGNPCEGWDTSDMAHRSGGLSVEQEKLCKYCGGIGRVVCDGRCMPKQEPVAWMVSTQDNKKLMLYGEEKPPIFNTSVKLIPLYTASPKREWLGLTDEEIKDMLDCGRGGLVDIKKAEQILREKNNA